MHTGEPRILPAEGGRRYTWRTGLKLPAHMLLTPLGSAQHFEIQFDPGIFAKDLGTSRLDRMAILPNLLNRKPAK